MIKNIAFITLTLYLFTGCFAGTQERVEKLLQTNSSKQYKKKIIQSFLKK